MSATEQAESSQEEKRTAVVFIHGQGEQQPTSSVREFADNVWLYDRKLHPPKEGEAETQRIFSVADAVSDLGDLTRLVTSRDRLGGKVDFYEYYWAHQITGTKLHHILTFFKILVKRPAAEVPKFLLRVRYLMTCMGIAISVLIPAFICSVIHALGGSEKELVYFLVNGALIATVFSVAHYFNKQWMWASRIGVIAGVGIWHGYVFATNPDIEPGWVTATLIAYILGVFLVSAVILTQRFLLPIMGDSARYLRPDPENVENRHEIITQGVETLERLHETGRYERIVIAAHSLGTVIGYEILAKFWMKRHDSFQFGTEAMNALAMVEKAADKLIALAQEQKDDEEFTEALSKAHLDYRVRQNVLAKLMAKPAYKNRTADNANEASKQEAGSQWLITDFVTFGSPLSYAHILLTEKVEHFSRRVFRYRDYPINPPVWATPRGAQEVKEYRVNIDLMADDNQSAFVMHPASVFAPVRWTNLYFETSAILDGDLIGGRIHGYIGAIEEDERSPMRGEEKIGRMGCGILDIQLSAAPFKLHKPLGDRFLHNEYWKGGALAGYPKDPNRRQKNTPDYQNNARKIRVTQREELADAAHLRALRVALNLPDLNEEAIWSDYIEEAQAAFVLREPPLPNRKKAASD